MAKAHCLSAKENRRLTQAGEAVDFPFLFLTLLLLALGLLLAVGGDWDWVTALMNLDFAGTLDCVRDLIPLKMDRLWEFAGLISVCLAGFNLIPLPGFDGARALGVVFKKKV